MKWSEISVYTSQNFTSDAVALDALRSMLEEVQHRSTVVDNTAVGSLLYRLQRLKQTLGNEEEGNGGSKSIKVSCTVVAMF